MNNYKPVLPTGLLDEANIDDNNYVKYLSNDITLKVGVVLRTIEIDEEDNKLKIAPEYTVMTSGDENITIYDNCISTEGFGNVADFFTSKLRAAKSPDKVKQNGSLNNQDGPIVLLLCLKGKSEQGIIVGSLTHPNKKTVLTREAGLHMEGEYNGVNWQVNKDGELTVTFKSASTLEDDGVKYASEEAGGTFIKVDKTGSIDLNDGKTESIKIDKTAQTIDIKAEKDITNTTNASFKVIAKENVDLKCTKDLLIAAEGKAEITIKKDMSFEIAKNLKGKAKQIELESETITKLKTRQLIVEGDEANLKIKSTTLQGTQFNAQCATITLGFSAAPALTMRTKFVGIGNAGMPIICSPIGPYSPGVFIAT